MPPKKPSASEESYNRLADAVWVPIKSLRPNPKNRNNHTDAQIERLAKLISTHGFRVPIIVSKRSGFVVAGHGRLQSAIKLGLKHVPVMKQDFASDEEEYQFGIAENAIQEWSELDLSAINADLADLEHFDLQLLGMKNFTADIAEKLEYAGDPDSTPNPPRIPKSKMGDLWTLGNHRLLCGDATAVDSVEKLMASEKADMVFTDPPYGVSYEGGHNKKKRAGIEGDTLEGESLTDLFYGALLNATTVAHEHAAFYIWYANGKAVETYASFSKLALKVRAVICWYKVRSGLGDFMSQYIPNYEPCIYAHIDGCSPQWFGPSDEKTVWELQRTGANEFHPTQKPVELAERAIKNSSKEGQIILDLFGGSGSTLIAAEKTGRRCFMSEIDPCYVDVILNRWSKYAGQDPVRDDGQSWLELNR